MRSWLAALFLVVPSLWFTGNAAAEGTFRLVDEEGVTHITDTPNDPRYRRISGFSATAAGWLKVPAGQQNASAFTGLIQETLP